MSRRRQRSQRRRGRSSDTSSALRRPHRATAILCRGPQTGIVHSQEGFTPPGPYEECGFNVFHVGNGRHAMCWKLLGGCLIDQHLDIGSARGSSVLSLSPQSALIGQGDDPFNICRCVFDSLGKGYIEAVLDGHTASVNCFSPLRFETGMGRDRVVSCSSDGTLRLWDLTANDGVTSDESVSCCGVFSSSDDRHDRENKLYVVACEKNVPRAWCSGYGNFGCEVVDLKTMALVDKFRVGNARRTGVVLDEDRKVAYFREEGYVRGFSMTTHGREGPIQSGFALGGDTNLLQVGGLLYVGCRREISVLDPRKMADFQRTDRSSRPVASIHNVIPERFHIRSMDAVASSGGARAVFVAACSENIWCSFAANGKILGRGSVVVGDASDVPTFRYRNSLSSCISILKNPDGEFDGGVSFEDRERFDRIIQGDVGVAEETCPLFRLVICVGGLRVICSRGIMITNGTN